jgi:hypothetical protein
VTLFEVTTLRAPLFLLMLRPEGFRDQNVVTAPLTRSDTLTFPFIRSNGDQPYGSRFPASVFDDQLSAGDRRVFGLGTRADGNGRKRCCQRVDRR